MTVQSLDTQLLLFINHHTTNALFDILMPALSLQGYLLVIPFLLAILARGSVTKNDRGTTYLVAAIWTILIACCAAYLAGWFEDWMKDAVARVRPCRAIEGIRLILPCPRSYSMPSGHAISSFSFALPLFYLTKRFMNLAWRLYPLLLASAIAFSRVYLGVHYPTDVLTGALLGTAIGMALSLAYRWISVEEFISRERR
ncbi:MAG: phosphatase PAP2 family protein [Nitrospiraceae bacterium]|nr:phosphatase PAP2 family protein [Nitrospiraceae bacterium]